ncbi:MAG: ribose 5-phosphate isomerase B [Bacillota bacterium]|jgi:ribose 5-phosphate isomerase B
MKIYIGSDHAGFQLKEKVKEYLLAAGHDVVDVGPETAERVDYPVYGGRVGRRVAAEKDARGVVLCGSGIGISIAANKVRGVRAALCSDPLSAALSRRHNDANVLALGARLIGETMAFEIVDVFLRTGFEGGRHSDRVALIAEMEEEW